MTGLECSGCVFWRAQPSIRTKESHTLGQCRRAQPVVIADAGRVMTRWPFTREDDWCGEHATVNE